MSVQGPDTGDARTAFRLATEVWSVMWQPQMKSPRPEPPVERGAMHHSERLVDIRGLHPKRLPPGGLWAITGHPNRKDIEVWC